MTKERRRYLATDFEAGPCNSALDLRGRFVANMTDTKTAQWPHITELLDQAGGHIRIGRMPPIEGSAIAVNDQTLVVSLVQQEGETLPELLRRLDAAIGKALHEGVTTNEINGGRFRLGPSGIRKRR